MTGLLHQTPETFDGNALLSAVGTRRDRAAFVALFNHYAPRVKSWLLRQGETPSGADEIVQNTFVSVWEKAAGYDPQKSAASTWIFTVARNKRIDGLRRDRFYTVDADETAHALQTAVAAAPDVYADDDEAAQLAAAMKTLPEEQERLLRMAFFEDKSHSAIAHETKLPLGTVKSRLRLALGRLKKILERRPA